MRKLFNLTKAEFVSCLVFVIVACFSTLTLISTLGSCSESIDLYGVDSLHQRINLESASDCDTSFLHYNDDLSDITCE